MAINIGMQQQVQVRGSDGSILWTGAVVQGQTFQITSSEASATAAMGEGILWDATNSVLPRSETTAAGASPAADLPMSLALYGKRIVGSGDVNIFAVALEPIGAGKQGFVAGQGSLCTVKTTATTIAIGAKLGSSATAGLCAAVTASTTLGTVLGTCFKINTVAAPGTGSTGWAGIHVNPC